MKISLGYAKDAIAVIIFLAQMLYLSLIKNKNIPKKIVIAFALMAFLVDFIFTLVPHLHNYTINIF